MKIYGPYKRNSDGRWIVIVDGVTISYPKYLYEKHYGVKIEEPWTVDHKDGNPDNNAIDNLQLLTRADNARKSAVGRTYCLDRTLSDTHKQNLSGYNNGKSVVPFGVVSKYRKLYESGLVSKQTIKKETGLKMRTIENFLNYKTYKY